MYLKCLKTILCVFVLIFSSELIAQELDFKKEEFKLLKTYKNLKKTEDSIEIDNVYDNLFLNQLHDFLRANPISLKYPFDSLGKYIEINTSKDSLFRVYSWNRCTGGTMGNYRSIFQFKNNKLTQLKVEADSFETDPDNYQIYVNVNQYVSNSRKVYILESVSHYSSKDFIFKVNAFTIGKNGIENFNFFTINDKKINEIVVELDISKMKKVDWDILSIDIMSQKT